MHLQVLALHVEHSVGAACYPTICEHLMHPPDCELQRLTDRAQAAPSPVCRDAEHRAGNHAALPWLRAVAERGLDYVEAAGQTGCVFVLSILCHACIRRFRNGRTAPACCAYPTQTAS